ncbi:MAG: MATE family efflux transporter [Myxococcota bacterium]
MIPGEPEGEPGVDEAFEVEDPEHSAAIPAAAIASRATPAAVARPRRLRARSEREIWQLAWPAILSQMLASVVSLIDIAMIGRLGTDALAAVGYATQFQFLTQSILYAVGTACVALMARSIGAGQPGPARSALAASLGVTTLLAAGVTAVVLLVPRQLLALLDAPAAVVDLAIPYFRLTLGSTLLLGVAVTFEHGFRADRDTRTPMRIAIAVTVVKTFLNALLIFGLLGFPRLDLVGAGIATLVAQVVGFGLFMAEVRRRGRDSPLRLGWRDLRGARLQIREVVRISLPAVAERVLMNLAIMAYFTLIGAYGSAAIAAYTVGVRILSFSWLPGFGFSIASATLVGQKLGASDPHGAGRSGWRAARLAVITSSLLGIAYALARVPLAELFTHDPAVISAMEPFMLMLALAQPFMGLHFTLGGALRGAGDTVTPLWAAALGSWGVRVPAAFVLARVLELDVVWVWMPLIGDHILRSIWMSWAFRRGRWKTRRV